MNDELKSRIAHYNLLASEFSNLNDEEVLSLIDTASHLGTSIGGSSSVLTIKQIPIFIKKIKLSDIEKDNKHSTRNIFNLPLCYQYGVGSAGFGAWRELAAHQMTTEWVINNECINFPLLYHYRILPCQKSYISASVLQKIEQDVAYWEGSQAIRERLITRYEASSEIVLFLEYFPENLYQWCIKQIKLGNDEMISSCRMIEHELKLTLNFMASHGLLHMDVHFWNILTDGHHLYLSDFGLALSDKFELNDEEIIFFAAHRDYDYCSSATNFLHAIMTGLFGNNDWISHLKKCIDNKNLLPAEINQLIMHYSSVAIAMDEFYRNMQSVSKETPFIAMIVNPENLFENQINQCIYSLKNIFGDDLLGVYLYGSAVVGGLQKYSDIDLFVVLNRVTTYKEKSELVADLLNISGIYMKDKKPPIELTIVSKSAVNPWKYPPHFDFQYGEWLRSEFENDNIEPWPTKEMPDLAILVTQVLLANRILLGPNPNELLSKIPYKDFMLAITKSLDTLMCELQSDTRNVLLTLARIWCTVETDTILPKPAAADWVINRLPENYLSVMKRAKAICQGEQDEYWDDLRTIIHPCADYMYVHIKEKIISINFTDCAHNEIKLSQ